MRITIVLMGMLFVMLVATMGVCGDGVMYVSNSIKDTRIAKVKGSAPTGYTLTCSKIVASGQTEKFDLVLQRSIIYTETWQVWIRDITGMILCSGILKRDKDGFSVDTPGSCFSFTKDGKNAQLIING